MKRISCLLIAAAMLAACVGRGNPDPTTEPAVKVTDFPQGTEAPAPTAVPTPDVTGKKIVWFEEPAGEDRVTVDTDPAQRLGTVKLCGLLDNDLPASIEKEENSDAVFSVRIMMIPGVIAEHSAAYAEEKDRLMNAVMEAMASDTMTELCGKYDRQITYDFPEGGQVSLTAYDIVTDSVPKEAKDMYLALIAENEDEETAASYRTELERIAGLYREYISVTWADPVIIAARAEAERLMSLGYIIDSSTFDADTLSVCGLLTKEQIKELPADPDIYYKIYLTPADIWGV